MEDNFQRFFKKNDNEENKNKISDIPFTKKNMSNKFLDDDNLTKKDLLEIQNEIEENVRSKLTNENLDPTKIKILVDNFFQIYTESKKRLINHSHEKIIKEKVLNEITGFGPLEELLNDNTITEIMVNRHDIIYIERNGELIKSNIKFKDYAHAKRILDKIVSPIGRKIDEENPTVDARLPQGFRLNAVIPPVAINGGPYMTIRKFPEKIWTKTDLIERKAAPEMIFNFLEACVKSRLNVCVSGGTGSGKTTLLNVLSNFIDSSERIVTVEDCAELKLTCEHLLPHETRPKNSEGKNEISIKDLIATALRQRPTRIIVGEVRKQEALDMLQAMSTGHDGSMTTGHANTPSEFLNRLEYMCLMTNMPLQAIKMQIILAVRLIVQIGRVRINGKYERRILSIAELSPFLDEKGNYILTYIFNSNYRGTDKYEIEPTGEKPSFIDVLEEDYGYDSSILIKPKTHLQPIS